MGPPWKRDIQHSLSWREKQLSEPFLLLLSLTPPPSLILALEKFSCYSTAGCSLRSSCLCWGEQRCWEELHTLRLPSSKILLSTCSIRVLAGGARNGGPSLPHTLCLPSENLRVLHLIMRSTYAMNKILVQSGEYTLGVFIQKGIWNKAGIEHSYYFR